MNRDGMNQRKDILSSFRFGVVGFGVVTLLAFFAPWLSVLFGAREAGSLALTSPSRILAVAIPALPALACLVVLRREPLSQNMATWLHRMRPVTRYCLNGALLTGTVTLAFLLSILWLRYLTVGRYGERILVERAIPLAASLTVLTVVFYRLSRVPDATTQIRSVHARSVEQRVFFVGIIVAELIAAFVTITRVGLVQDNAFWGKPTVPLLESGLLLTWTVVLAGTAVQRAFLSDTLRRDVWIAFAVYLTAVAVWLLTPAQPGFFAPAGRAPNYEIYPFSDGAFYGHYARALINGMGYKGADIPPRPLYIALLALFHLPGAATESVVLFQTLFLALLPVCLYLLGRELHGRVAGIAAALLCILREVTSIQVAPFAHNVTTTKYFFADLPTALAATFFMLMLIRAVKALPVNPSREVTYGLAAGGALGVMTLIRTQSLTLILLAIPALLFGNRGKDRFDWRPRLLAVFLFVVALTLSVSPWLIRNHAITGSFVFDHPRTQTGEMANSYNIGNVDLTRPEGMDDGTFSAMLAASIQESIRKYPREIAEFVTAHFFNSLICTLRIFPMRADFAASNLLHELIVPTTAFWETLTNDQLSGFAFVGLVTAILLSAFGVAVAVRKNGVAGALPIIGLILFNFSTAVGRYSAGRYLIPMDWAWFVIFAVALSELAVRLGRDCGMTITDISGISGSEPPESNAPSHPHHTGQTLRTRGALLLAFLLIGAFPTTIERFFPLTLTVESPSEVRAKLGIPETNDADYLHNAIAIYPRYYAAGEGEPESAKEGYDVVPYGRLIFLTLTPDGCGTMRLRLNQAPETFPDNALVRIAGTSSGAVTEVEVLQLETETGTMTLVPDEPDTSENYPLAKGTPMKEITSWLNQIIPTIPTENVTAVNFNLYEDEGDAWTIECIGAPAYDPNDDDWACDEMFTTRDRNLTLTFAGNWQAFLNLAEMTLTDYFESGLHADRLRTFDAVTVGFTDGNLTVIWRKEA